MGLFDFFTKPDDSKAATTRSRGAKPFNHTSQSGAMPGGDGQTNMVYKPASFDEVSEIINRLSLGKPAIVHLKHLNENTAQRVLDLLSGAIYALHGGLFEIETGIYLFSLDNGSQQ